MHGSLLDIVSRFLLIETQLNMLDGNDVKDLLPEVFPPKWEKDIELINDSPHITTTWLEELWQYISRNYG